MSEIVREGRSRHTDLVAPLPVRRQVPRTVQRAAEDEMAHGLIGAARVQAAAWVAAEAMTRTSMLTALEQREAASDPVAADRYAGFVDDFVMVARQAVRRMGVRP